MDSFTAMPPASAAGHLPAQRIDAAGRTHVDQRAVLALALPLMANSAVQIVLNLTDMRSEEHTSELQSRVDLVCRLLLEKKKKTTMRTITMMTIASTPRSQ